MKQKKKVPKWRGGYSNGQKLLFFGLFLLVAVIVFVAFFLTGSDEAEKTKPVLETADTAFGVDVAKYQGTIDWQKVSDAGVQFAMVRVGYRGLSSGEITADSNAKYNMQEAAKYGIKLGAYFFSTAVSEPEAEEEARWVADFISQYPITYPVAYDCERFLEPESRQYGLTNTQRTDIALAFLRKLEELGYEGMFYSSRNDMMDNARWEMERIDQEYKVWVAQYPEAPYPDTPASSYTGVHQMWQYASDGIVSGIGQPVDLNIAYFSYDGIKEPLSDVVPDPVLPDPEALMPFREVSETVTAKSVTNLRSTPSQDSDSRILGQLNNGDTARRVGISDSGWSKLEVNGHTCYAVSNFLTTDLNYVPEETVAPVEGVETSFTSVDEMVTAKDYVNLRNLPSVTHEESKVIGKLTSGDTARRIGISDNGWSMLEYGGKTCYAVSNYLVLADGDVAATEDNDIDTVFTPVQDLVTAKDVVNLRSMPSVEHKNSEVVAKLKNGEVITRTGINTDVGWSRVDYNGQTLYCISSYLKTAE